MLGASLATAWFARNLLGLLKRIRVAGRNFQIAGGATMSLVGIAMITDQMSVFSIGLTFPVLGTIG